MTENPNQEWQLRLFGEFSLTDPAGVTVRLPDRKVEGLLAILALNSEYGMERREIADTLWSQHGDNLSNLRQALSVLRRVLGADAIEASRSHCRLTGKVLVATDYDQPTLRRKGGFMPGHEGDWFEDIRRETIEDEPSLSVIGHFLQTLQWFSVHDPRGMYALMSASPPMVRSISYEAMDRLLNATSESNALSGWHAYWRGTAEIDLEQCARLLRTALREARRTGDMNLASETCYELGKVYSRTGNIEKALRVCDIADEVAASTHLPSAKANALRLRGNVEVNWRLGEKGFRLLEQAEEFVDAPVERATALSSRAFFEASAGLHERASFTLERAELVSPDPQHFRMNIVNPSTRAILMAAAGRRTEAIREMEALAVKYRQANATQFLVYAQEFVAKLYVLEGDKAAASEKLNLARQGRLATQMAATPLEAKRVAIK